MPASALCFSARKMNAAERAGNALLRAVCKHRWLGALVAVREFGFELLDHARQAFARPFFVSRFELGERLLERTALLHDLFEVIDHLCGFPSRVVVAARLVAGVAP